MIGGSSILLTGIILSAGRWRDAGYLCIYLLVATATLLLRYGYLSQWMPDFALQQNHWLVMMISINLVIFIRFIYQYLLAGSQYSNWQLTLNIATALSALIFLLSIFDGGSMAIGMLDIVAILLLILLLIMCARLSWNKVVGSLMALLSISFYLGLQLYIHLDLLGWFEVNSWVEYDYEMGIVVLILLLSAGLARQIGGIDRTEYEAKKAVATARSASSAKSDFLAKMSHEIRTPLNGVLGMAQLLLETSLDKSQRQYMETLYRSGKNLLRVINDILDYSKIEAGKLDIENTHTDLIELMCDVSAPFQYHEKYQQVPLIVDIAENVPKEIVSDPLRLGQVITNLLSNAYKFTTSGCVKVCVRRLPVVGSSKAELEIEVQDTGIGIKADRLEKLFDPRKIS